MGGFVGLFGGGDASRALAVLWEQLGQGPGDGSGIVGAAGAALAGCGRRGRGDDGSRAPIRSADGRLALAFDGRILGDGLDRLRRIVAASGLEPPPPEAGDGPLLAEALSALARGFGALESHHLLRLLDGSMGALAVLDLQAHHLWLVRDRLGIKPLHARVCHGEGEGEVWFASEIRTLLVRFPELRRVEASGLAELFHWQRPVRSLPFPEVESLRPGAVWRLGPGGRVARWTGGRGTRDLEDRESQALGEALAGLGAALGASARAAVDACEAPSLFLSGGLDSGAVALLTGRSDLLAFTGRFRPWGGALDESEAAATVARAAGIDHVLVDLEDARLLEDLPAVVEALEIPMAGPGALALWRLAARVREHGRIVLTGTGGDELLGGYARTALVLGRGGAWTEGYEALRRRIDAVGEDLAARQREALDRSADLMPLLHPDFLASMPAVQVPGAVAQRGAPPGRATAELVAEEIEGTLPMLLHVDDRIATAHGLEGRPVLCLGDVPQAAGRVPAEGLVGPDGEGKRALRSVLEGVMPDTVRNSRHKRGFPTPFARAVRGATRAEARAVIEDRRFRERGWWDVEACRGALVEERPVHDRALYTVFSWEFWARAFLDGDAFPPESAA